MNGSKYLCFIIVFAKFLNLTGGQSVKDEAKTMALAWSGPSRFKG